MKILITGGASGLGEAITKRFAKNLNCKVFFTYHRSKENADAISTEFSNTEGIKCDFSNENDLLLLSDKIKSSGIDVLINNAYSSKAVSTYFHKIPATDFLTNFTDDILPTIQITQEIIQLFRKQKSGKIITILTSFLLNRPPMGTSTYVASKAYLAELTKVWAVENGKFNITSNSISPAFMKTGLSSDVDERVLEQMEESHPLKKLLTPAEVAETAYFLAFSSAQINGVNIPINAAANIK